MATYPQPSKQAAAYAYQQFELVTFTVAAKVGNAINVAVVLKDSRGNKPLGRVYCSAYLASAAAGVPITPTNPTSATAIGTNGSIIGQDTSNAMFSIVTDTQGRFDINITQPAGGTNYYLVIRLPNGAIVVSPVIAF